MRSAAVLKRRRATIKDVAAECGLALSTVSNALTNKSYVTEETRKRVQEAANRLGYRASAIARGLRLNRTLAIGVLVADVANPSVVDHLRGIDDVTTRENFSVILCNTDGQETRQLMLMQTLRDRHVRWHGIDFAALSCSGDSRARRRHSICIDAPPVQ